MPQQSSLSFPELLRRTFQVLHSPQLDPIAQAEKQVKHALDGLVQTGALQAANQMDIKSLLNPVGESHAMTEASDKEIYQAIMDTIK